MTVTERLTEGVRTALAAAGLPAADDCAWEVPRQAEHGDYATNVAMTLARAAKRPPRQIADVLAKNFPAMPEVARVEVAGPGFLNVFLAPAWTAGALHAILAAGASYGQSAGHARQRTRLEFVSANPTGPLVIVNARAAAVGDSLARLLRSQGARVTTEFYVNDAGTQFEALARSFEARVRQEFGETAALPENGSPGEYLVDLAKEYRAGGGALDVPGDERARLEHFGRWAVEGMVEQQRRTLAAYGVDFDVWSSEQRDVRDRGLAEKAVQELTARGLTYEQDGALWFRSTAVEGAGDDQDRVLRRRTGELTYFAVDIAFHHYVKFAGVDHVIDLLGPDHHGHVPRIRSVDLQVAEQGMAVPARRDVDVTPLAGTDEQALIKWLLEYPNLVAGAARAHEPHRVAYWLTELAGLFHPYYKTHRVIQDDRALMLARLALCTAVGQVIANGLALLGVSAPGTR